MPQAFFGRKILRLERKGSTTDMVGQESLHPRNPCGVTEYLSIKPPFEAIIRMLATGLSRRSLHATALFNFKIQVADILLGAASLRFARFSGTPRDFSQVRSSSLSPCRLPAPHSVRKVLGFTLPATRSSQPQVSQNSRNLLTDVS